MIVHKIKTPVECSPRGYNKYTDHVITTVECEKVQKEKWRFSLKSPFFWKETWTEVEYRISQIVPYLSGDDLFWDYRTNLTNQLLKTVADRDRKLAELWIKENK